MPGSITHSYVLYRALSSEKVKEWTNKCKWFERILKSHNESVELAKKNKPDEMGDNPGGVLSGCAYIGSCGPDLFYLETGKEASFIADLLHYNRSGLFVVWMLCQLRQDIEDINSEERPDLESQLAYCLGHISHIAADITIHPYVNSIVGAYPEIGEEFENARGSLYKNIWKFHHILEHYQDAYVLHKRFIGEEKFGSNPYCVNLALPAAKLAYNMFDSLVRGENNEIKYTFPVMGFVPKTKKFYRYSSDFSFIEKSKYAFFANENTSTKSNWHLKSKMVGGSLNINYYYDVVIPNETMMKNIPTLVQGSEFNKDGKLIRGLFDNYIETAVNLTLEMWDEAVNFLGDKNVKPSYSGKNIEHRISPDEMKRFKKLGQHWNLDCGIKPEAGAGSGSRDVEGMSDTKLNIGAQLSFNSIHKSKQDDFKKI